MAGSPTFYWGQSTVTVAQGETVTVTSTAAMVSMMSYSVGDTSIATATPNSTWTSWTIQGVSPGTTTVTVVAENAPGPLTITVTGGDDENFLNERGLIHFWDNINNIKQDKLKAGTNITISADNTISADLETELSQYVTAEDIASTSALTPPVQTNMIADGAVTTAKIANKAVTTDKIDWTAMPVRYTSSSTDNKPTVNMTVNLPPRVSNAYTLYLSTIGGSFTPTEHVVFFRISGTDVVDTTPGKLSSTGRDITSISVSNYNSTNHTVQLSVTYNGAVYWQLFVRAYNRGGTY